MAKKIMNFSPRNISGCSDPTAEWAIGNVTKEEKRKRKKRLEERRKKELEEQLVKKYSDSNNRKTRRIANGKIV